MRRCCRVTTMEVSIHAPAKGATIGNCRLIEALGRFNPRPREGGDDPARSRMRPACFNPRPREGGDARRASHACLMFQSTPPRRGRLVARARSRLVPGGWFQSTPPRRGRPIRALHAVALCARFNPRPREGGDSSTNSAFCLQRNPGCPCEMVTSAGTSEPFGAENFGKPHDLNRLNEVRTFRGSRARLRFALATTSNDQRAAEINGAATRRKLDAGSSRIPAFPPLPSEQFDHLDRFRKAVAVHRDFIVRKTPGRRVVTEAIAAGFNKLVPDLSVHLHTIEQSMGMGIAEC